MDKQVLNQWSNFQNSEEIKKTFYRRKPREKLTSKQINFISDQIEKSGHNISELSIKYRISKSLLLKIKKMRISDFERKELQQADKVFWTDKQMIIQCIQKFIKNRTIFLLLKNRSFVFQNFDWYYQYNLLHKIMKKDLNLSYKRCKPRPNSINLKEVMMKRILFCIKIF